MSDEPVTGELVPVVDAELVDHRFAGGQSPLERVYVAWMLRAKSGNTRESYARVFRQWKEWLEERGVEVLDAETVHVDAWQRHMESTPHPRTGKPLAPASIANRVSAVSSFYERAKRLKVVAENPAADSDRPDIDPDHSETRALTEDEARRLIAAAFDRVTGTASRQVDVRRVAARDADLCALLMATGMRVSECVNAKVEDLGYDSGMRVLYVTRKGGKREAVPLGAATEQIDRRVAGRTSGPIFTTRTGRPVSRHWVKYVVKRLAIAAAIPAPETLTVHALRSTFATLSIEYNTELIDLQVAMGHRDPRTTLRYVKRKNRIDRSPVHVVSNQLLAKQPDQRNRLF